MIQVIPSIAIRRGKVVKMRKGDPASEKAYDENPLDLAKRFEDHGIAAHLLARLTCPIGLPGITGKEPEQIAVAVVAQLLQIAARPAV